MKNEFGMSRRLAPLLVAASALLPAASYAHGAADSWQWRASIYGWFPSIDGSTNFPSGGGGPSIDVDASTIIDGLDFIFMGAREARKGR